MNDLHPKKKLYLTYPKVPLCIGFTDSQMVIGNCLYSAITNSYQLIRLLKMLHVGVPRCEKYISSVKCDGLGNSSLYSHAVKETDGKLYSTMFIHWIRIYPLDKFIHALFVQLGPGVAVCY